MKCIWRRQIIRYICLGLMLLAAQAFAEEPRKKDTIKLSLDWKPIRPEFKIYQYDNSELWSGISVLGYSIEWSTLRLRNDVRFVLSFSYFNDADKRTGTDEQYPFEEYIWYFKSYRFKKLYFGFVSKKGNTLRYYWGAGLGISKMNYSFRRGLPGSYDYLTGHDIPISMEARLGIELNFPKFIFFNLFFCEMNINYNIFHTDRVWVDFFAGEISGLDNTPPNSLSSGIIIRLGMGKEF